MLNKSVTRAFAVRSFCEAVCLFLCNNNRLVLYDCSRFIQEKEDRAVFGKDMRYEKSNFR